MQVKWIVLILMSWIVVALLVGVVEGVLVGGAYDSVTGEPEAAILINQLADGGFFERANALAHMMFFDFETVFYGAWGILQWIFFLPFAVAFAVVALGWVLSHIPVIGRGS